MNLSRNAAGVPGLEDFIQLFQAFLGNCHRQLSRTAKFLLFRHKRGADAFFVHNFVIP